MLVSCKDLNQSSNTENQEIKNDTLPKIEKNQSPLHENLSKEFNYQSFIERIPTEYFDSCLVNVVVSRKDNERVFYKVNIISTYLLGDETFENDNVRSYITGANADEDVVDNDYGDIVVADFNFDNFEDFAIKREEGGNGGPLYNFYIQSNQNFIIDNYLSDTIVWFPNKIDKEQKILQTLVRASAVSVCEETYKYNSTNKTWKKIRKQFYGEKY